MWLGSGVGVGLGVGVAAILTHHGRALDLELDHLGRRAGSPGVLLVAPADDELVRRAVRVEHLHERDALRDVDAVDREQQVAHLQRARVRVRVRVRVRAGVGVGLGLGLRLG